MSKIYTLTIIHRDNKVLLGMKKRGYGVGRFNGFGGKPDVGETLEQAAIREVKEEAGVQVLDLKMAGEARFIDPKGNETCVVYIFRASEFIGEPSESEEMAPQWFDVSVIPFDQMWPDDRLWLPYLLEGVNFKGEFKLDEENKEVLDYDFEINNTPDFYRHLPKKRCASGVLFFNEKGEILIVKPVYKIGWSIPGGIIEEGESPVDSLKREVQEELGLKIENFKFGLVEYRGREGNSTENFQFLFDGGVISGEQISEIKLPLEELKEFKFSPISEAKELLNDKLSARVIRYLEIKDPNHRPYLENGYFID